jgi:hypothetical protein
VHSIITIIFLGIVIIFIIATVVDGSDDEQHFKFFWIFEIEDFGS